MTPEELEKITERVIQRSAEFTSSHDRLRNDEAYFREKQELVDQEDAKIEKRSKKLKEERDR